MIINRARNADGRGLSTWDAYADTLGKIKNENTGDAAYDYLHRHGRTSLQGEDVALQDRVHWKLEEWRVCPGSLPVLGWLGKGVHLRSDI